VAEEEGEHDMSNEWSHESDSDGDELTNVFPEYLDEDIEMQALLDERDAIVAMITERKFAEAVRQIRNTSGESGVMELIFAVEKATGWHMEIVASKSDVEDTIFNWYGVYDEKAWNKIRNTELWEKMTYDVNFVSRRAVGEMVREVSRDPERNSPRNVARRILFDLWKAVDLKLS